MLIAVALAVIAVPGPVTVERVRASAAGVLRSGRYQTELPGDGLPPLTGLLDLSPALVRAFVVTVVAAALALTALWLVRHLRLRREEAAVGPSAAEEPAFEDHADAAARLAAEGRFAEAIHLLLLDTLAELSRAARLSPSLTSREIVALAQLAPAARTALADLVRAVEVSYFGEAIPAEAEYRACSARFQAFLASYRTDA